MSEMELYSLWCENAKEDPDLKAELEGIKGDSEAINDRFYRDLEFGTGGLRGVIGAGTNRMNIYTVRRATQGFADYLNQEYKNPSVAISYDSRIKSDVFSKAAAEVLAANGIKVHIYKQLMPTPCLSWAVRALKCQGGIMVTASHNPAKYNGYKVYGEDGCQITLRGAEIILEKINSLDMFSGVKHSDFDKELAAGNISYIDDSVIEEFYKRVLAEGINTDLCASSGLKVVYTPLNGTGNKPVREILKRIGITDVTVVKEQENPDGNFTTCPYPNPEIREALQVGLSYCDKVKLNGAQTVDTSAFANCANLAEIDVTADKINTKAFYNSGTADGVTQKASLAVNTIGTNAFENCSTLNSVTIKSDDSHKLASLGASAFNNCKNLNTITINGNPTMGSKSVGFINNKVNTGFILVGDTGSTVNTYATNNNIKFRDASGFDPSTIVVPGDANCDDTVDMSDIVLIMQALASPNKYGTSGTDKNHITTRGIENADVFDRGSGMTNADALQIQKYLLKLIDKLS